MVLPNYLIIGERRSGTTTLANYLKDHPEIFIHPQLDMGYFIDEAVRGRRTWLEGEVDTKAWRLTHDAEKYAALFEPPPSARAIGEKSADYLFWRPAHERIKAMVPDVKLIAILRDPAERAWSHYWNEVGKGRENLSFEEALRIEVERLAKSAYARDHLSYKTRGFYDQSVSDLLKVFRRDQVLVICLEQLIEQPIPQLRKVYEFLEVDPARGLGLAGARFNTNWTMMQRPWVKLPVLGQVEEAAFATCRTVIRRLTRDKDQTRKWLQTLFWCSRLPQAKIEKPARLLEQLREEYQESIDRLELLLDQEFQYFRGIKGARR